MSVERQTTDLHRHFDHHDASQVGLDPYPMYRRMRECPVGWSDMYSGFWVVTGFPEAYEMIHKPETFSSFPVVIPPFPGQERPMIPIEIDPPDHFKYRTMLSAPFSPRRAAALEGDIRVIVTDLIDEFIERGECDFAEALARPLPTMLAARILGLPLEDGAKFQDWTDRIIHESALHPEVAAEAVIEMYAYFYELLERIREDPGEDDVLSILLRTELEGDKLTEEELLDFCFILMIASIDTTQKSLGSMLWYLGEHEDLRRQLVRDSTLIPTAVEEFLRYLAPVYIARTVMQDTEISGCPMKAGERALIVLPSVNRDEREFADPDQFMVDRRPNRHIAFGSDIHRCLGSHVARVELRVVLEEVLQRIPDFRLAPGKEVTWATGQVQGIVAVPVVFPPGKRRDSLATTSVAT